MCDSLFDNAFTTTDRVSSIFHGEIMFCSNLRFFQIFIFCLFLIGDSKAVLVFDKTRVRVGLVELIRNLFITALTIL